MTAPIDPSQSLLRLAALLRSVSADQGAPARGRQPANAKTESDAALSLQEQLRAIDPDHPRRRRAMARVLVESLLLKEFGADMGLDPGFQAVIDEVVDAMHAHAATGAELDRLVAALAGLRPDL